MLESIYWMCRGRCREVPPIEKEDVAHVKTELRDWTQNSTNLSLRLFEVHFFLPSDLLV